MRSSLGRDPLIWAIFAVSAAVTVWTESEIVWIFVACGVVAWAARGRARRVPALAFAPWPLLVTGLGAAASGDLLWRIFVYFAAAGAFVFGSGLAIIPFLHGAVANELHWLTERQFLDAVAVAMITPGPVVITVAFIGYLVAGPLGATAAAFGVFLPCYLFVVIPATYFRRAVADPGSAFVGADAAATGATRGGGRPRPPRDRRCRRRSRSRRSAPVYAKRVRATGSSRRARRACCTAARRGTALRTSARHRARSARSDMDVAARRRRSGGARVRRHARAGAASRRPRGSRAGRERHDRARARRRRRGAGEDSRALRSGARALEAPGGRHPAPREVDGVRDADACPPADDLRRARLQRGDRRGACAPDAEDDRHRGAVALW
jgi:chromate transport protein ChrA